MTPAETRERLARVACFADECCWSRERPCGSPADCEHCKQLQRKIDQRDKLKRHSDKHWAQAARQALDGKPQNLINRIAMYEDYPVDAVLS